MMECAARTSEGGLLLVHDEHDGLPHPDWFFRRMCCKGTTPDTLRFVTSVGVMHPNWSIPRHTARVEWL